MLNKILVAIDESASSEWAFDTALDMAKALNAELLLVHVLDAFSFDSPMHHQLLVGSYARLIESSAQKECEREWQQFEDRYDRLLEQRRADAEAAGVAVTHLQIQGTPERKICEVAKTHNVDLIVTGNRDRTNQNSISHYLTRHAPCSVTVVHPKAAPQATALIEQAKAVAV